MGSSSPAPAIISEAGGQGLHVIVGFQALGPAIARWGDAARSFLALFPTKVIFRGVFDPDTVHVLSSAAGEYDRQLVAYRRSTSSVRAGAMQVAARSDQEREDIRLIRSLAVGTLNELRQMVTVLRVGADRPEVIALQPRVADIPDLVRSSEIDADLDLQLPEDLPLTIQRTVGPALIRRFYQAR